MDVRCDRCQTEYELDEMRLTATGVAVKCTNCGNVFKVRRTQVEEVVPARQKVREWHVRRQDGTTLTLRELTDLQKAVVERRVAPDDSVSLSGESWHQLGSMPELASFFEVVEAANQALKAKTTTQPMPVEVQPSPPTDPDPLVRSRTPMWGGGPQSFGPVPAAAEPAWARSKVGRPDDPELTELLEKEDLQAVKRGRGLMWLAVILVLLAGGGTAGYFFVLHSSPPGTIAMAPPKPPDVNAPIPATPPEKPAEAKPAEPKPAEPAAVAAVPATSGGAPAVPPPAVAPAAAPTPAPVAPTPAAVAAAEPAPKPTSPPSKPAKAASKSSEDEGAASGKSFDYYISQGHKVLDSKPTQALALFQKAAELDPQSPEPDSGRGLAYANMDKLGDAASAFQAALKKSPEFTEAIMGLAEISRAQGNAKKAIGLYQRYLDLTPDGADAPAARAQLEQLKSAAAAQAAAAPKPVVATPVAAPAPTPAPAAQPAASSETAPPPVVVPDQPAP
jgi:predicted Zn finger-like uncharacterized protein